MTSPAGRSSSRMPSGVSTATTVSSPSDTLPPLRLDDDGVRHPIVQALAPFTEDEQHFDDGVARNEPENPCQEIPTDDQRAQRRTRAAGETHLDVEVLLRERLAGGAHLPQRQPAEDHESNEGQAQSKEHETRGGGIVAGARDHRSKNPREVNQGREDQAVHDRRAKASRGLGENDRLGLDHYVADS